MNNSSSSFDSFLGLCLIRCAADATSSEMIAIAASPTRRRIAPVPGCGANHPESKTGRSATALPTRASGRLRNVLSSRVWATATAGDNVGKDVITRGVARESPVLTDVAFST